MRLLTRLCGNIITIMVHVQALGAMRGQTILIGKVGVYGIGHAHFTRLAKFNYVHFQT